MTYPTTYGLSGLVIDGDDGHRVSYADDGAVRISVMYSATQYRITFVHNLIESADEAVIMAYYDTNKLTTFSFTDPTTGGIEYTCHFAKRPSRVKQHNGTYRDIAVELVGIATV